MIFQGKRSGIIFFIFLVFNLLGIFCCFAQEEFSPTEVIPYYPENESLTPEEKEIQSLEKSTEERLFMRSGFLAVRAFRKGDREICNQLSDSDWRKECEEEFDGNTFIKYLAKGRCGKLDNLPGFVGSKMVCQALRKKDCSSLKGYQRMLCEAFLKRDKELCRAAINTPEFISQNGRRSDNAHEEIINLHYGFKTNSDRVCEQFSQKAFSETRRLTCKFLFSRNPEFFQKQLIEDLTYFVYVREHKKDEKYCEEIRDPFIRKACYNPEITELKDLLNR